MTNNLWLVLRVGLVATIASASLLLAAPAAAHGLKVTPPGQDPVVEMPISKSWAQAHCHAQSPETLGSVGAAEFSPASALPCPPASNPGGQIHPQAQ